MYTLRRILEDGTEYNFILGENYTLILKERVSQEDWDAVSKNYWGKSYEDEKITIREANEKIAENDCFGFIQSPNGEHFLLPWQQNYIMIDGKTVFRLNP